MSIYPRVVFWSLDSASAVKREEWKENLVSPSVETGGPQLLLALPVSPQCLCLGAACAETPSQPPRLSLTPTLERSP